MGWLNLLVTTSNEPSNWINERQKNNDEETKTNNGWSLKWKRQKILLWFDEACVPKASRLAPPHFYKGDFFLTSRCYKLDFCQLASHKRKNIDSGYDFSIRKLSNMKKQIIHAQTRIFWSAMYLKMPSEWHLKDSELQWFGKSLLAMIADLKRWKLSMTPWPYGLLNSGYDILVYGRTFTNNLWWTSGQMNNDAANTTTVNKMTLTGLHLYY